MGSLQRDLKNRIRPGAFRGVEFPDNPFLRHRDDVHGGGFLGSGEGLCAVGRKFERYGLLGKDQVVGLGAREGGRFPGLGY